MKHLLSDLPDAPITPARHRKLPALDSTVFASAAAPSTPSARRAPTQGQTSHIVFDDSVAPVVPSGVRLIDNIFGPTAAQAAGPAGITIDVRRMESHLFDDASPFRPAYPLDAERLKSHIFDAPDAGAPAPAPRPDNRQLGSRVFEQEGVAAQPARTNNCNASHFVIGDDTAAASGAAQPLPTGRNMASQLHGPSLCVGEAQTAEPPRPIDPTRNQSHFATGTSLDLPASIATKATQSFAFKSSIAFGDDDSAAPSGAQPRLRADPRPGGSQICFDATAAMPKAVPARKPHVGNVSQITF